MKREKTQSLDKFFLVSSQPIFKDLSDAEKAFVANRLQIVEYNKNDIIYNEKDKKGFLYIVASGRILLFSSPKNKTAKEITIEVLRKGDYFGIISLLTGRPHSASAKVINDTRILRIDEKSFRQILNKIPRVAIQISRVLSRRLNKDYAGPKEVFQTTIVSLYYQGEQDYVSEYALSLAAGIRKESGKKAIVLNINKKINKRLSSRGIKISTVYTGNPKDASSVLSKFIGNHHFVIVNLPAIFDDITKAFIRQSDTLHIVSDDAVHNLNKLAKVIKKIPNKSFKVILREKHPKINRFFDLKVHGVFPNRIYATLPSEKTGFDKAVRRISREITGELIGLALGSGGAMGLAQVGVLKILEKEKIPVDIIVGTSIGALVGSLWACGYNTSEIEKICTRLNTRMKALSLIDITFPKRGLLAGNRVRSFLYKYLKNKTFYDIKRPFKVVSCDIATRKEVIITSGRLVDAVMASIAIPGVFNPFITKDGRLLVDGGIINPVPISVLSESGIKRIIAVNSMPSPEDAVTAATKRQTILDIIVNSFYAMEYRIARYACQQADVYLHPILKNASWYEFYKAKEFIRLGQRHARKALPEIKQLIRRGY